ncbi:MAG: alkaline phosphatase family protein [Candidatus Tyrphobacter sp.]
MRRILIPYVAFALLLCGATIAGRASLHHSARALDAQMPRYAHIFVIVEENKNYSQIFGQGLAPGLDALARRYGNATEFYAETHPSEPNYVALVGGYTFGIRDDDAYFCRPRERNRFCPHSFLPGYVDHTIDAPNLATQLEAAHLTWKNYLESIPSPGSLLSEKGLYVAKHSGFINFVSVQRDPHRAEHLVGFDEFYADLKTGRVPNFALVIPNVCNEMHGASSGPRTPPGCAYDPIGPLVHRGDDESVAIVRAIQASRIWRSRENVAIVITWDENDAYSYVGCCGNDPRDPSNRGGGHIPTIVVTNRGPRHVADATPYSHYSLLRTIEDAFGIRDHLRRASAPGVVPMVPLFRISPAR